MEASLNVHGFEPDPDELRDELMGFMQTIEMIRPSTAQITLHRKPDGRIIAKPAIAVPSPAPTNGFAFENWFWHIASMPGCFSAMACLLMVSELLAPL